MKCLSRSTYGIVIGGINVLGFICTIIYIIVVLSKISDVSSEYEDFRNDQVVESSKTILYIILVLCLIAVITSGLLIMGIIKRRCSWMRPWIYSAIGGIVIQIVRVVVNFFTAMVNDISSVLSTLFIGLFILAVEHLRGNDMLLFFLLPVMTPAYAVHYFNTNNKDILITSIQYAILYPIYTLFKDIRDTSNIVQEESNLSNEQPPNYSDIEKAGETYN